MTPQRQLEYETPPEEQKETPGEPNEPPINEGGEGDDIDPWSFLKPGSVLGTAAFATIYLVAYQLSLASRGGFEIPEGAPPTWVLAGFTTLMSHGGTYVSEQDELRYTMAGQLGTVFLIPLIVLALVSAGYLLGRTLEPSSPKSIGLCAASIVPSYLMMVVVTAQVTRFTPTEIDETGTTGGPGWSNLEGETIAISLDGTLIGSTIVIVFAFACIGVVLSRWSTLLGIGSGNRADGSTEPGEAPLATGGDAASSPVDRSPPAGRDEFESGVNATRGHADRPQEDASETNTSGDETDHDRYRPATNRSTDETDHDRYRPSRE
ncbi:hypothetical protein [Natronosalvus vescus]|uniref:hypothetical protein n=1 Tax=Natronosalvus vescus TaxID=2953881 RepID=UPI0020913DBA|nr:hypothetical protein [Natronosalvus vescus]